MLDKSKGELSKNTIIAKDLPRETERNKEITNVKKKTLSQRKDQKKPKPCISGNIAENNKKPTDLSEKELIELASIGNKKNNSPDKSSVYTAISDYIFAYKNRDMKKLGSLFHVHAKENGVSMDKVFKSYQENFKVLNILAYDIKFNEIILDNKKATVDGDFIISFKNEDVFKKSYGDINWKLTWSNNNWLINEIRYNVTSTKVQDDFGR